MWEPWSRRRETRQLEARLRSARPEPREELVSSLVGSLTPPRRPRAWSRVAFAAAFTTVLLGTFASFGGIGYAASGAAQAVDTLKTLSTKHKVSVHSSADAQYPGTPQPPQRAVQPETAARGAVAVEAESSALPFTGISLVATALVGLALLATGLILRRRERSNT